MKRFNKVFTVVLSVGVAATNLVGAERWVRPAHLDELQFPIESMDETFAGLLSLTSYPSARDYQAEDFVALNAQFEQAKAAEKRALEEDDGERPVKRTKRIGKVPKKTVFVPRQVHMLTEARRKIQAKRAAAMIYAQTIATQKSMAAAGTCMTHTDKDPRQVFVLGKGLVAKTIEKAQLLAAMLREQSGIMTPGTRDEFGKLVDIPANYATDIERFIALLTHYADAIAAEKVKMDQEEAAARLSAVGDEPVRFGMRQPVEERVSPKMRAQLDTYGSQLRVVSVPQTAPILASPAAASSVSVPVVQPPVPTVLTDPRVGIAVNAQAMRVVNDITSNGWLMEALWRVVPGAVLGASLATFGIFFGPFPILVSRVAPIVFGGTVFGAGLNMIGSHSKDEVVVAPRPDVVPEKGDDGL